VSRKPYVIAISSVTGGGKSTLAKALHQALPNSTVLCFDDFDDTNVHPDDYYEWYVRGADLREFDCPGMALAVDQLVQQGEARYLILDFPFGRDHPCFREAIDLSVFIDTPLDVAMARRILRDYPSRSGASPNDDLRPLQEDLAQYLARARYPYLEAYNRRITSELVLDGWQPIEQLRDKVLEYLRSRDAR
jgi:uridine kinase